MGTNLPGTGDLNYQIYNILDIRRFHIDTRAECFRERSTGGVDLSKSTLGPGRANAGECGRGTSLETRFGATTKFRNHHQSAKVGSIESDNIIVGELFSGLIIIERRRNTLISSVPLPVSRRPCEFHLF